MTHDIIVRLTIPARDGRPPQRYGNTQLIRDAVLTVLMSYGQPEDTSVGVAITYADIAWTEGKVEY